MDAMSKKKFRLTLDLQNFAEGDPTPTPAPVPTPQPVPIPAPTPEGKVWTDEYVSGLRAEAKEHRLGKKQYETHLRSLLGLTADDEISESRITAFQTNQQEAITKAMSKANERLIAAEIKAIQGYDLKLVDKLLDRSKLTIDENGTVTGLQEQITALETEFPAIKVGTQSNNGAINPGATGAKSELEELEELYTKATTSAARVAITGRIHALRQKT